MDAINVTLNHSELSRADFSRRGGSAGWPSASTSEHLARLKREALIEAGHAPEGLRLEACWTEDRRYHVVLVAATPAGDVVLDSRRDEILPLHAVRYRWVGPLVS